MGKIYISGDGSGWGKKSVNYILKSLFSIDKYHLTKYINMASNQMLDEAEIAKRKIYRLLYKRRKKEFGKYIEEMEAGANNQEAVTELKTFVMNNWNAVMRTLHDKN